MIVTKFYIEGGRDRTKDVDMRRAFRKFLEDEANRAPGQPFRFDLVLCGDRRRTYKMFCNEADFGNAADVYSVLLVDADAPVAEPGKCWKHLKKRPGDGWDPPAGATDEHVQFMAQAVEAWFFADPDGVEAYYKTNNGTGFNKSALGNRADVETLTKDQHKAQLDDATRNTSKKPRPYSEHGKTRHLPGILEHLDPAKVRQKSWHCRRLFERLAANSDTTI